MSRMSIRRASVWRLIECRKDKKRYAEFYIAHAYRQIGQAPHWLENGFYSSRFWQKILLRRLKSTGFDRFGRLRLSQDLRGWLDKFGQIPPTLRLPQAKGFACSLACGATPSTLPRGFCAPLRASAAARTGKRQRSRRRCRSASMAVKRWVH